MEEIRYSLTDRTIDVSDKNVSKIDVVIDEGSIYVITEENHG